MRLEKDQLRRRTRDGNDLFSGTFGGYVKKDVLWFFLAGSEVSYSDPSTFPFFGVTRPDDFDNHRSGEWSQPTDISR